MAMNASIAPVTSDTPAMEAGSCLDDLSTKTMWPRSGDLIQLNKTMAGAKRTTVPVLRTATLLVELGAMLQLIATKVAAAGRDVVTVKNESHHGPPIKPFASRSPSQKRL
jgi:hypothetical protein